MTEPTTAAVSRCPYSYNGTACAYPLGHPPIPRHGTFYQHADSVGTFWNDLFPAKCADLDTHDPHVTDSHRWCDGTRAVRSAREASAERPAWLRYGLILAHRREAGRLARVDGIGVEMLFVTRVDDSGWPVKRARSVPVRFEKLDATYQPYRPCRWDLHCLTQASTTVQQSQYGAIDACDEHAAAHAAWTVTGGERDGGLVRAHEPEPDCWCTDRDRGVGETQPYCPPHGTPEQRGTSVDPRWLALPVVAPAGA